MDLGGGEGLEGVGDGGFGGPGVELAEGMVLGCLVGGGGMPGAEIVWGAIEPETEGFKDIEGNVSFELVVEEFGG